MEIIKLIKQNKMKESTIYMVKLMFNDVKDYFDKDDLNRFESDLKALQELYEEEMKETYIKGYNDRWNVNRTDLNQAFKDYFNNLKI